jgi:hypothetical protein
MKKRLKLVLTSVFVSIYGFILLLIGQRKLPPVSDGAENERPANLNLPYGVAIFGGVCAAAAISGIWGVRWLW